MEMSEMVEDGWDCWDCWRFGKMEMVVIQIDKREIVEDLVRWRWLKIMSLYTFYFLIRDKERRLEIEVKDGMKDEMKDHNEDVNQNEVFLNDFTSSWSTKSIKKHIKKMYFLVFISCEQ